MKDLTEADLLRMEAELEAAGWNRQPCDIWMNPVDGCKYRVTVAYGVMKQQQLR